MSKPLALYNDNDPFAACWLRELVAQGHIAHGGIDERPIQQLDPRDLKAFTQCHFFAKIGVWGQILRLAGWPDETPVWTIAACPEDCWRSWTKLVHECRPPVILGESATSPRRFAPRATDLERKGYRVAAVNVCLPRDAEGRRRKRVFFVAVSAEGRSSIAPPRSLTDLGAAIKLDGLHAYGVGLVAPLAATFVPAVMDILGVPRTKKPVCPFEWIVEPGKRDLSVYCEEPQGHEGCHRFVHMHADGTTVYEYPPTHEAAPLELILTTNPIQPEPAPRILLAPDSDQPLLTAPITAPSDELIVLSREIVERMENGPPRTEEEIIEASVNFIVDGKIGDDPPREDADSLPADSLAVEAPMPPPPPQPPPPPPPPVFKRVQAPPVTPKKLTIKLVDADGTEREYVG